MSPAAEQAVRKLGEAVGELLAVEFSRRGVKTTAGGDFGGLMIANASRAMEAGAAVSVSMSRSDRPALLGGLEAGDGFRVEVEFSVPGETFSRAFNGGVPW